MKTSTLNLFSTIMYIAGSFLFCLAGHNVIALIGLIAAGFTCVAFLLNFIDGN